MNAPASSTGVLLYYRVVDGTAYPSPSSQICGRKKAQKKAQNSVPAACDVQQGDSRPHTAQGVPQTVPRQGQEDTITAPVAAATAAGITAANVGHRRQPRCAPRSAGRARPRAVTHARRSSVRAQHAVRGPAGAAGGARARGIVASRGGDGAVGDGGSGRPAPPRGRRAATHHRRLQQPLSGVGSRTT